MFMLDSCWCLTFCLASVTWFGAFFHGFSSDVAGRLLKAHILVYTGQRRQRSSEEQIILAFGHNRGRQGLRMSRTWAHTQMSDPFGLQGQEVGGLFFCVPDSSAVPLFFFLSWNNYIQFFIWTLLALWTLLKHFHTLTSLFHLSANIILTVQQWTHASQEDSIIFSESHEHFQQVSFIVFNDILWCK